jgi:hypothetical protein
MALSLVGILAGVIGALAVAGFAAKLLYQISPRDPVSLAAAISIMLGLASLAALIPARRAARVDPVVALRCEYIDVRRTCDQVIARSRGFRLQPEVKRGGSLPLKAETTRKDRRRFTPD